MYTLTGLFISYTFLVEGWTPFAFRPALILLLLIYDEYPLLHHHCHLLQTSLRYNMMRALVNYPAGRSHQKMVHGGHKGMDMVSSNTQVGCGL